MGYDAFTRRFLEEIIINERFYGGIMKEQEIVLNLKLNTYKQLSNLIHNELKMSKENLEEIVRDQVIKYIETKLMTDESFMDEIFKRELTRIVHGKFKNCGKIYNFDALVQKMIKDKYEKEINEKISSLFTKQVLKTILSEE
jgi:hypothetical protein